MKLQEKWLLRYRFVGLLLLTLTCLGCSGDESPTDPKAGKMVYVDSKTSQAFIGAIVPTPAVNPQTGEPTLMPGMYCPKCSQWHPVPPLDQINRIPNARQCGKTRTPLVTDGPWPDQELDLVPAEEP